MELGEHEFDREHFANQGSLMTVVTSSEDIPEDIDDLSGLVQVVLYVGPLNDSRKRLVFSPCACPNRPDPRTAGVRPMIAHLEKCSAFAAEVDAWRSHPTRAPKWRRARVAYGYRTGDLLRRVAPATAVTAAPQLVETFLADCGRKLTDTPVGRVTPIGQDVASLPETTSAAVEVVALLLGKPRRDVMRGVSAVGDPRILDCRGLGLRPTRFPRRDVTAWVQSTDTDVVNNRASVLDDARRLGASVVYGVRGQMPVAPLPDLRAEVAELQRRLAELEARAS